MVRIFALDIVNRFHAKLVVTQVFYPLNSAGPKVHVIPMLLPMLANRERLKVLWAVVVMVMIFVMNVVSFRVYIL